MIDPKDMLLCIVGRTTSLAQFNVAWEGSYIKDETRAQNLGEIYS